MRVKMPIENLNLFMGDPPAIEFVRLQNSALVTT